MPKPIQHDNPLKSLGDALTGHHNCRPAATVIVALHGKKLKMLKRHLYSSYGLTPDDYRAKWGLPSDYPMVAPNYAKSRSELAIKLGLGRRASE